MIIAVDFDGTIVEHKYPLIGAPVPNAITVLRAFNQLNDKVILWTMRSGKELDDAVDYLDSKGIKLWGVNENPDQKSWTDSPKQYAQIYIDDAALGCPLIKKEGERPFVDWVKIGKAVYGEGFTILDPDDHGRQS